MAEDDRIKYTREDEARNSLAAMFGYPHVKVGRMKSPFDSKSQGPALERRRRCGGKVRVHAEGSFGT